jgi:hypothetical protein
VEVNKLETYREVQGTKGEDCITLCSQNTVTQFQQKEKGRRLRSCREKEKYENAFTT